MTIINVCNLFALIDWNNKYSYSILILIKLELCNWAIKK